MISTTHQGLAHSRLERAKDYIHRSEMTSSPTTDDRDVTANTASDGRPSNIVSPTIPPYEMIEDKPRQEETEQEEEESTEDVAHLLTIVADIAAREAPLPVERPRIRTVSMASPDLRPHPPPPTPMGGDYSLLGPPQTIPPSSPAANDFRPPIRRHGAPIQERSYDEEPMQQQAPSAYSYSSSSSDDGHYVWSATAGPREQRQPAASSSPPKPKKHHRHRHQAPAPTARAPHPRARPQPRPLVVTPKKKRQPRPNAGGSCKVLHKKFSWKKYPEVRLQTSAMNYTIYTYSYSFSPFFVTHPMPFNYLLIQLEEFLIANRDEYLRHSTLNYTAQQKQYNNRLTERLLELAAECGYIFDEHEFSFVAVRDRIRCYYKSYVQSLKKRGIVIGYAARKAGMVTNDDLEKSACKKSTIYVPNTMKH